MGKMTKWVLGIGVLFLVVAVAVFVFADGMRRWYSGIFFAIIGAVALAQALRGRKAAGE
jgi:hypothetical protein